MPTERRLKAQIALTYAMQIVAAGLAGGALFFMWLAYQHGQALFVFIDAMSACLNIITCDFQTVVRKRFRLMLQILREVEAELNRRH